MGGLRNWTDEELAGVFLASDPTLASLFRFVQQASYGGRVKSHEPTTVPKFNFYLWVRRRNGSAGPNVAFEYRQGWDFVRIFLSWQKYEVPDEALVAYRADLRVACGDAIDLSMREPGVPLSAIADDLDGFKAAVLEFRDAVGRVA